MSEALVYLNGEFLPAAQARVPLLDRGYLLGDGLFETMRAYAGRIFRLERHLDRLVDSAREISLPLPPRAELTWAVEETVRRFLTGGADPRPPGNACGAVSQSPLAMYPPEERCHSDRSGGLEPAAKWRNLGPGEQSMPSLAGSETTCYVRLTVSRGAVPGLDLSADVPPTLSIIVRSLALPGRSAYERGWKAHLYRGGPNPASPLPGLKSLCMLPNLLARQAARAAGADEAILVNSAGQLAEAAFANLFLVRRGEVLTPALECGVLPGITRDAVIEVCRDSERPVRETILSPDDLTLADECFLTNSLIELLPVTSLADRQIGSGTPGPVTAELQRAYRGLVARETGLPMCNHSARS